MSAFPVSLLLTDGATAPREYSPPRRPEVEASPTSLDWDWDRERDPCVLAVSCPDRWKTANVQR